MNRDTQLIVTSTLSGFCLQDVGKGREHMYRMYGSRTMQEQLSRSGSFTGIFWRILNKQPASLWSTWAFGCLSKLHPKSLQKNSGL